METDDLQKLQEMVQHFQKDVLFNENESDEILGVFIDKKEQQNRVIILTNVDCDDASVNATAEAHFGKTNYKILKKKGLPKSTSTLITGGGIRNAKSQEWGTMGGVFKIGQHEYGLSNKHVLAGVRNAKKGDECIYHPNIKAGTLYKWYNLNLPPAINYMDAAIFKLYDRHKVKWNPVKPDKWIGPRINLRVYKQGVASQKTKGIVSSYNGAARVKLNGQVYNFSGIISIRGINQDFNQPGDSGSIVFSEAGNHMVALVFAKFHGYCWALPISRIQHLLK